MIVLAALGALSVALSACVLGYEIGVRDASERFYEECRGGEMHYVSSSGEALTAVGCAEMARHIR